MHKWSLFVVVAILASVYAVPAKANNKKKPCLKDCGEDYKPVCGGDGSGKGNKSFGSKCVLENYNCEKGLSEYREQKLYAGVWKN